MINYQSSFADSEGIFRQNEFVKMVVAQLREQGYCILEKSLPAPLANDLYHQLQEENIEDFKRAGVGRKIDKTLNEEVRRDTIRWIDNSAGAGKAWLLWMEELKTSINRELILGLFSFESHFACYEPGAFYKKHVDAFPGDANRILSVVAYLNPSWQEKDGGELVLYDHRNEMKLETVPPGFGTMVFFLSEEFPHEVRLTKKIRYSIAGWFRLNSSINGAIDPPR